MTKDRKKRTRGDTMNVEDTYEGLAERWRKRAATMGNGDGAAKLVAYHLLFAADELDSVSADRDRERVEEFAREVGDVIRAKLQTRPQECELGCWTDCPWGCPCDCHRVWKCCGGPYSERPHGHYADCPAEETPLT